MHANTGNLKQKQFLFSFISKLRTFRFELALQYILHVMATTFKLLLSVFPSSPKFSWEDVSSTCNTRTL